MPTRPVKIRDAWQTQIGNPITLFKVNLSHNTTNFFKMVHLLFLLVEKAVVWAKWQVIITFGLLINPYSNVNTSRIVLLRLMTTIQPYY